MQKGVGNSTPHPALSPIEAERVTLVIFLGLTREI
jgi:hypothetical protein